MTYHIDIWVQGKLMTVQGHQARQEQWRAVPTVRYNVIDRPMVKERAPLPEFPATLKKSSHFGGDVKGHDIFGGYVI